MVTIVWTLRDGQGRSSAGLPGPRRGPRSRGAVGARRSRRLLSLRDTARAMSQENVEIVRCGSSSLDGANSEEFELGTADPGVEFVSALRSLGGWGLPWDEGVARGWSIDVAWEISGRVGRFHRAGDRVFVLVHLWRCAGRAALNRLQRWATAVRTARRRISARSLLREPGKPSKPRACRSKTLTPTPEPAGYCAGDVAGERESCTKRLRSVESRRPRGCIWSRRS